MKRWLSRDGVVLWHEERGEGDTAVVFVHGFVCDHSQWAAQMDHLAPDHRVVAVDLRGHGRSDAPEQDYTMEGYADDVAWVCDQLGIRRAVVVGHSMGGIVVALLTARRPDLAAGVVVLDAAIVPDPALTDALVGWADALRGPDHREVLRAVNDGFFEPTDPLDARRAVQDALFAPQHVAVSSAEHMAAFVIASAQGDALARPETWTCPAWHVSASHQMNDMVRFRSLCPQLVVGQTIGSGHYHQVVVPDQINAMVRRAVELVG